MSIRQLPEDVVGKLKSSTTITSLNAAVNGLLSNALDGGATKVNISVDYARGSCTVEDNGCGIPPAEFKEAGGLGKLHHTSKFPPDDSLHGRHGNFLASLGTLSLLCISSRSRSHVSHSSILIHNSGVISRHVPARPEQRLKTFDHGTRVVMRDLFGLMPVRVKQRPDSFIDRASIDREWSQLVHDCAALLLSWSTPASVLLREAVGDREVRLRATDNMQSVSRASALLMQASLTSSEDVRSLVPVSVSGSGIQITGCMSTKPVATRRAQFISIGVQPIANDLGTNVLYEEINRVFSNSSFSMTEDDDEALEASTSGIREKSSRKRTDRWPMFHLQIQMQDTFSSHDLDDLLDDRGNNLSTMLDLLKAVCYSFLKNHHLRPKKITLSNSSSGTSSRAQSVSRSLKRLPSDFSNSSARSVTGKSTKSTPTQRGLLEIRSSNYLSSSPFAAWKRTKVGHSTSKEVDATYSPPPALHDGSQLDKDRLVGEGGRLLRKPFADAFDRLSEDSLQESSHFGGSRFRAAELARTASLTQTTPSGSALQGVAGPATKTKAKLPEAQESWVNPVFESAPPAIPRLYDEQRLPPDEISMGARSKFFDNTAKDCGVMFEAGSVNLTSRISKTRLSEAEIIAQVDRKFILLKMPLNDEAIAKANALIMLDQHAVDERCQLEDLMQSYFEVDELGGIQAKVEPVEKPLLFEFSDQELELMQQYQLYLSAWGITYDLQRAQNRRGRQVTAGFVKITGLPPSINERCSTEPRLLAELIRREVWDMSESRRLATAPFLPFVDEDTRISNFHRCPKGILDLLHSRACRSAIMFNDVLTMEDCERLVRRLARCSFPFQCAHGRPSMAPLVDLGVGSRVGGWHEEENMPSWQRWMHQ